MNKRIFTVLAITFVIVVSIALSPSQRAQGHKRFVMRVAYVQNGSPAQIESVTNGTEYLFQKSEVKNVSDKTIRSITFGVLFHEIAPNSADPILVANREIATNIKPGEIGNLSVDDLTLVEAQQKSALMKSNQVVVEFGILGVQFSDGTNWTFDWRDGRGFSPSNASTAAGAPFEQKSCKPILAGSLQKFMARILPSLAPVFAAGYICAASANNELCTNNGQSCTNRVCHKSDNPCPKQLCELIP